MTPAAQPDHRKQPRRRGAALNTAIFDAVLAEIAESGYAALTMDRVAERARASKASLYRRWPGRAALVLDAAYHAMPAQDAVANTGSLREDTLAVMRQAARQLEGIVGQAMHGLLAEALQDPAVAAEVREFARGNAAKMMREIVANAVNRGELDPAMVTERRLEAGPALLRQRFIFTAGPIGDDFLAEVVDEVVLPLFGVHQSQ
ncbi:TetR/AcrR family transcriptional regulator [Pseudarthrobacter albicanus]|uniref:TetR/AcrR family transcriptional regulator n=1 Tax=Pseudarthrobacter albicanus TaxID=2823873 RepID=UPI001BAC41F8|nr:TetR/AcrR family transcriptional regulator [Pseudarthrobacter albicanus]